MAHALLEPYLDHLRALPFARAVRIVPAAKGQAYQVAIRTADREERLHVELKTSHLSADLVERWASEPRPKKTILFVPAVGRDLGDRLQQLDLPFVDRAGNCYVNLSGRYVSRVQGRRSPPRPAADKSMRAAAYRALFALLADPKPRDRTDPYACGGSRCKPSGGSRHPSPFAIHGPGLCDEEALRLGDAEYASRDRPFHRRLFNHAAPAACIGPLPNASQGPRAA